MSILPRSTWTSTPFGFARFPGRKLKASAIRALIVHWPGSAGEKPNPSPSLEASCARLRGYRNYHVRSRGWADIGYPYAIDQAGRIFTAAGSTHAAAHSATGSYKNANHENLAVLLMLAPGEEPTAEMVAAFRELRAELRETFRNMTGVMGHQDVKGAGTSCPGPAAARLIRTGALVGGELPAAPSKPSKPKPSKPSSSVKSGKVKGAGITVDADGVLGRFTVRALQERLIAHGYKGHAADGDLGNYTVRSLQRFLRDRGEAGHAIDGDLGSYTVRSLQSWLRRAGYKGHAIDGDLGRYTVTSLQLALIDGRL